MKPIVVIVARHLPTRANEGHERLRGQGNNRIDQDEAEELAPKMAKFFDDCEVDCIYCSDLPRGIGSAKAIESYMEHECEITPRSQMRTWDVGKFTGEPRDDVWKTIEKYIKNPEIKIPGDERYEGESFESFIDRWRKELLYQVKDAAEDEHNAWILHGNQFWAMMPLIEGRDPALKDHVSPSPGSIFRLELATDSDKVSLEKIFDSGLKHRATLVS